MSQGKLVIFSAPSGSGKTTIVKKLLEQDFALEFSVSATSRPPRGKEQNGVDYYFLTPDEFRKKIAEDAFLEWEEVYPDRFYGTLKSEVERITQCGKNVIFDVDVVGGLNIKKFYGNRALSVFISPPSIDALRTRLTSRGTDDAQAIETRLAKAEWEMNFSGQFDMVIVNENLEIAVNETEKVVRNFLNK
jgi:guanylate kinase